MEKLTLSVREAAQLLGISHPKCYELARREDFPAFKVYGRTLISREGLQEWVRKQTNHEGAGV